MPSSHRQTNPHAESSPPPQIPDPKPDSAYLRQPTIFEAAIACTGNINDSCPCCRDESCSVCKAWGKYWWEVRFMTQAERISNDAALMAKVFRNVGTECSCSAEVIRNRVEAMVFADSYPRYIDEYLISCREVGCAADFPAHGEFRDRPRPKSEIYEHPDAPIAHGKVFFIRSCCDDEHDMKLIRETENLSDLALHAAMMETMRQGYMKFGGRP